VTQERSVVAKMLGKKNEVRLPSVLKIIEVVRRNVKIASQSSCTSKVWGTVASSSGCNAKSTATSTSTCLV